MSEPDFLAPIVNTNLTPWLRLDYRMIGSAGIIHDFGPAVAGSIPAGRASSVCADQCVMRTMLLANDASSRSTGPSPVGHQQKLF